MRSLSHDDANQGGDFCAPPVPGAACLRCQHNIHRRPGGVSLSLFLHRLFFVAGTYGTVFKAKNRETHEIVALKRVRLDDDDEVGTSSRPITLYFFSRTLSSSLSLSFCLSIFLCSLLSFLVFHLVIPFVANSHLLSRDTGLPINLINRSLMFYL